MFSIFKDMRKAITDKVVVTVAVMAIIMCVLIKLSSENYLLFHCIVEIFCFMIPFGIFTVSLNSRYFTKSNFYIFFGIGYFFVGSFKILHTLSYPGLGVFNQENYNLAAQLYHSSRYIQAITLLISCVSICRPIKTLKTYYIFMLYFIISALLGVSIFYFHAFPVCYIPEKGSTIFKIGSTIVSSGIMMYVAFFYYKKRKVLNRELTNNMIIYCVLNSVSEILFLYNLKINSTVNMFGHILEVLAFYFIYKGIVETGIQKPYDSLFGKFTETSEDLKLKITENQTINQLLHEERNYREKIEEALFDNKVCSNLLMDNSPIAITVHSEGKFIFANNKMCELLEIENQNHLIGEKVTEYMTSENRKIVENIIREEYKTLDMVKSGEMKMLSKRGNIIDVNLIRTNFIYEGKAATFAVFWDISMTKQIEALEKNVKLNKELLDKSREFNKIITDFFTNISHELRTPLNVIYSAVQVLDLNNKWSEATESSRVETKYLNTIKQNCYRLLRLINNLIDLSKVNSGYIGIESENHNIVNIVEDITLSVADYIKDKDIDLIFDTDVEEKIMACDIDKIERIMLNLLSNAVKFTRAGDKIEVNIQDKKDKILIVVRDTGIGIPKEKLDVIFERFRQVDSSLSRRREGSGIGLSLIKSLVEIHKGKITVKSKVGAGTKFTIELPVTLTEEKYDYKKDILNENKVERINIEFSDIYS